VADPKQPGEELAEILRTHYDLGDVGIPKRMVAAHQRRHRKLIVDTAKGRFLLKTYSRDPYVLDALRFQHRLSDHMRKNDLPAARIQKAKTGAGIVEIEDWALELQEFIEGEPMKVTSANLTVSAKALGKFHVCCRDLPHPDRDTRTWRFSEVPREMFAKLYERAKSEASDTEVDDHCNRIALFLQDAGNMLTWQTCSQFETGLIHGDWHSGNLLFNKGRLAGIIDLEFAGDGCYLEDLAYAASNLCIRTSIDPTRLERRMEVLLTYYQRYRTLSPKEERALYYAVGIKHVATVAYQSVQMDGTVAGYNSAEWMRRLAIQCEWLSQWAQNAHPA